MRANRRRVSWIAGVLAMCASHGRADLRPDELLLLTNSKVAQSGMLADYYAKARGVAADRILALDLPPGEEVPADLYDARIAEPVRAYLNSPAGQRVRCVVAFYGLPLRVGGRAVSEVDRNEVRTLRRLLTDLDRRAVKLTESIDQTAKAAGIQMPAGPVDGVLAGRQHFQAIIEQMQRPGRTPTADLHEAMKLAQQASIVAAKEAVATAFDKRPATQPALSAQVTQGLFHQPRDAAARATLRDQVALQGGVFPLHQVIEQQLLWINGEETDAAVDSELALVLVDDLPRYRWQPNPMHFRATAPPQNRTLMTARIDAPTPAITKRLIDDTLQAERAGLDGKAVFDSRGISAMKDGHLDGYGWYDQAVRDAAAFVKARTALTVVADDRERIMPPREALATALYCGWYSLRNYVPSCTFVRGAVGYHVASLELVSLHDPGEKGWVANLIKDGVVATLGAVSEPYLASFPKPEEFFPLLLTGRVTLAEVYWATNPMTSWKVALIGDPLYRPYAKRPALAVNDLSPELQAWLKKTEAVQAGDR